MKAICLLSGGIDSPVAIQIAILNGFKPVIVHYHNFPFHSLGTLEKVVELSNMIVERNSKDSISLVIIPHGKSQETLLNNLEGQNIRLTCLLCRMQMFLKAELYAQKVGADVIVTGEILGEQASQTSDNLPIVISKITTPVIRPLIGYNKEEVVQLSKKWGFYNLSIMPGGCCSINPRYPETKGKLEVVEEIYFCLLDFLTMIAQTELLNMNTFPLPVNLSTVLDEIET
ncbi:MAG: hypothetical protein ACFFB2_10310 [Promethearchaeota archaeon]